MYHGSFVHRSWPKRSSATSKYESRPTRDVCVGTPSRISLMRVGAARLAKLAGSFPDGVCPHRPYIFVCKAFYRLEYTHPRDTEEAGGDTIYRVSNFKARSVRRVHRGFIFRAICVKFDTGYIECGTRKLLRETPGLPWGLPSSSTNKDLCTRPGCKSISLRRNSIPLSFSLSLLISLRWLKHGNAWAEICASIFYERFVETTPVFHPPRARITYFRFLKRICIVRIEHAEHSTRTTRGTFDEIVDKYRLIACSRSSS